MSEGRQLTVLGESGHDDNDIEGMVCALEDLLNHWFYCMSYLSIATLTALAAQVHVYSILPGMDSGTSHGLYESYLYMRNDATRVVLALIFGVQATVPREAHYSVKRTRAVKVIFANDLSRTQHEADVIRHCVGDIYHGVVILFVPYNNRCYVATYGIIPDGAYAGVISGIMPYIFARRAVVGLADIKAQHGVVSILLKENKPRRYAHGGRQEKIPAVRFADCLVMSGETDPQSLLQLCPIRMSVPELISNTEGEVPLPEALNVEVKKFWKGDNPRIQYSYVDSSVQSMDTEPDAIGGWGDDASVSSYASSKSYASAASSSSSGVSPTKSRSGGNLYVLTKRTKKGRRNVLSAQTGMWGIPCQGWGMQSVDGGVPVNCAGNNYYHEEVMGWSSTTSVTVGDARLYTPQTKPRGYPTGQFNPQVSLATGMTTWNCLLRLNCALATGHLPQSVLPPENQIVIQGEVVYTKRTQRDIGALESVLVAMNEHDFTTGPFRTSLLNTVNIVRQDNGETEEEPYFDLDEHYMEMVEAALDNQDNNFQ
jgi:hypothetical protein